MPPAQNMGTGRRPVSAISLHQRDRRLELLGPVVDLGRVGLGDLAHVAHDRPQVAHRLDDVARAGLALGADHGRPLADAAQRLTQVGGSAHERDGEGPLVDVVGLVGRGEDFALVDVVHRQRFQHLGLGEMADAGLGHDRDGDHGLDALDHLGVAHPGHPALAADVRGDPLQCHHGHRAGVFGDLGLLGVDDVHDDAALQHLGEASFDQVGAGAPPGGGGVRVTHTGILRGSRAGPTNFVPGNTLMARAVGAPRSRRDSAA